MPSQNYNFTGNTDWLNLLASHEYRHVVQYRHALRGANKILYALGGANTFGVTSYLAAPAWFWEGDAVATETAFTSSGRGRIPNFDLILRTNIQEGRSFNYHKQYLESYKNNISNWYVLGYQMVSYLRKRTNDPFIWDKVTDRAWNVPFIPFRFSSALKKETGLYVTDLYNEMVVDLQKEWKAQRDSLRLTPFEKINQRKSKAYTDYLFPQELEDGRILVRKSGIGDIEQLVALGNGDEERIFIQGQINDAAMLSVGRNKIVWNEFRFDPRWQVRTYSTVMTYNLSTGQKKKLASQSRYAGAAISPDGEKVATIETSTEYKTKMLVLEYSSGRVLKSFDNPENDFISMPHWSTDSKSIVALVTNSNGKAIARFDFETGEKKYLSDFSNENIGYPVPFGGYVLYNSPVSGIDNIYALELKTGKRYQITCSKYGAYNAMVSRDGKWIYYNDQGRDGMDVVKNPFEPMTWKEWTLKDQPGNNFDHLVEQEGHPSVFNNIPKINYQASRYHRWKGIFNPYSWGATLGSSLTSNTQIPIGITSQDVLSTTQLFAGVVYDRTEQTWLKKASVSYQGWYPIIDFSFSQGNRNSNESDITIDKYKGTRPNYVHTQSTQNLTYKWNEQNVEGGFRLPLNTTTSKYVGNVSVGNAIGFTKTSGFTNSVTGVGRVVPTLYVNDTIYTDSNHPVYFISDQTDNGNLIYNHFAFSGYRLLKQSHRDINSKFGQAFFVNLFNTPYGGDYTAYQFSFYGLLFFPGLAKHHSLWGYWAYQNSKIDLLHYANSAGSVIADNGSYQFRNQIPLPRGLSVSRYQNMYSASANYTLPIWYPDISVGPLLNIQRVRANGFFDYGFGSSVFTTTRSQTYMSTGIEVKFDINVMRLLPQIDIGFRYSQGLSPSTSLFEFLIGSINF
ncbi:MAG TPA: hypothetical protein DGG95_17745 [Cytophagales bacterium]|nr:hypothetical protein [Cytophagales bacterium]